MKDNPIYLIVGSGRVARHFEHYFTLLGIPSRTWSRKQNANSDLEASWGNSDVTLLLISDSSIDGFIQEHPFLSQKPLVHFSGALTSERAVGMHPLNTFGSELYDLETYQRTHFICDAKSLSFSEIFPRLKNPHHQIQKNQRGLYHALCVLAGNFTTLLWEKSYREFENQLRLPAEALLPYLETVSRNLHRTDQSQLTGPLARRDSATIEKNLMALKGDPFEQVYSAFVSAYPKQLKKEVV